MQRIGGDTLSLGKKHSLGQREYRDGWDLGRVARGWAVGLVAVASLVLADSVAAGQKPASQPARTDWFHQARWGVFTHYMADTVGLYDQIPAKERDAFLSDEQLPTRLSERVRHFQMSAEEWNAYVDRFDVHALARQLKECGAGYYVITLGQNSGHFCAPNATYDRLVGISPSKCSKRDLISDLYAALEPLGIKLMVYLPAGAPARDDQAVKRLEWQAGPHRNREFQVKWEQVIADWSRRWGGKVKGWWFDGCYDAKEMYLHAEPPNFQSFAAAARAGNPDAIVAFNPGVMQDKATKREYVASYTKYEDYAAGEIGKPQEVECAGRWIGGEQWHMLSYIGKWWYWTKGPRFSEQEIVDITRRITAHGGVVTWDVMIQPDGRIPEPLFERLKALGTGLRTTTSPTK